MSKSQVMGSPVECSIGGRTFKLYPLNFAELGEVFRWATTNRAKMAMEELGDLVTAEDRRAILREVVHPSKSMDMAELLGDPTLIIRLLYMGVRKGEGDLNYDEFKDYIRLDNISELQELVDKLTVGQSGEQTTSEE